MAKKEEPPKEGTESRLLVEHAFYLARSLGVRSLLVQAEQFHDVRAVERIRENERIIWLTPDAQKASGGGNSGHVRIRIPDTSLTRESQMKIGLFLAVHKGHIDLNETIVCLSGVAGSSRLDTLLITNPHRDFPWFRKLQSYKSGKPFPIQTLVRLLEIALRFASEGREGKPIGTIFVIGDPEQLEKHTRQLILNPCEGHPRKARSIYNPRFFETLRELAVLDGAFIVSAKGVVESAGTYLDAPAKTIRLRAGLGARHAAAAALTAATDTVTVVLSQSSGAVTVFHTGQAVLELERPKPFGREAKGG